MHPPGQGAAVVRGTGPLCCNNRNCSQTSCPTTTSFPTDSVSSPSESRPKGGCAKKGAALGASTLPGPEQVPWPHLASDCAVCGKYVSLFCLMTVRRPSGTHTLPFPTAGRKPQHRDRGTEHTFPGQQCEFPL